MSSSKKGKKDIHKKKRHSDADKHDEALKKFGEYIKKQAVVEKLGEIKPRKNNMPEIIMEFIKDELEARMEQDEQREIINAGIACWNIACFGDEKMIEKQFNSILNEIPNTPGLEETMRKLIERKVTHYSKYKYFITNYEIERTVLGTWDLTISSFNFKIFAAIKNRFFKRS